MQEVSGSIPLTSTKFAGFSDDFNREKVVNVVKYNFVLINKQYRFKFQGPHRLEA
jgi:hypothetical protein